MAFGYKIELVTLTHVLNRLFSSLVTNSALDISYSRRALSLLLSYVVVNCAISILMRKSIMTSNPIRIIRIANALQQKQARFGDNIVNKSNARQHRAQILIGRESLQSHVPVFMNRPMIIFESITNRIFRKI